MTRFRALIGAVALTGVLLTAACSSDDSNANSTSSVETSTSAEASTSDTSAADTTGTETTAVVTESTVSTATDSTEPDANTGAGTPDPSAPAATTAVPAPVPGNINETVPEVPVTTQPAVPLTEEAETGTGVAVSLTSIDQITAEAQLPGEITGPGLKITISVTNSSAAPIDLSNVVVDVQDSAGTPTLPMTGEPAAPFTGSLAPGATASGVYVVALNTGYQDPASVSFSFSADAPVLLFVGNAK